MIYNVPNISAYIEILIIVCIINDWNPRYKQIESIVVILDVMDSYMDPIMDEFFTFSLTFEWINSICKWIHRTEKKNILICIFPYYCSIINFLCILVGQIQLMLMQQQHSWLNIVIFIYCAAAIFYYNTYIEHAVKSYTRIMMMVN